MNSADSKGIRLMVVHWEKNLDAMTADSMVVKREPQRVMYLARMMV